MKLIPLFLSLLSISFLRIASAQAPDQPPTSTIRGVVVTANDRKPISQALVSLLLSHRSVTTNENGEFVFTGVPFGTEVASAKKTGFLCAAFYGPHPECGKSVDVFTPDTQVRLTMLPEAVVTGHIVDQDGKPVPNIALHLMNREIAQDGRYVWSSRGATNTRTDAGGAYRIAGVEPGSYLLQSPTAFDPPGNFPPRHPDHGYSSTWYPGVLSQNDAQPLVVLAGDLLTANLTIRREPLQAITLNYRWNISEEPGPTGFDASDAAGPILLPGGPIEHSHSIRLLAPPGDYQFSLVVYPPADQQTGNPRAWPDGTNKSYMGSAQFTVRDQPIIIDNIPLQQPLDVALHVHSQSLHSPAQSQPVPEPAPVAGAVFHLVGGKVEFNNQFEWRADKPESEFLFKDIPPGQYMLQASGNSGAYVASLTCGSVNLLREPLVIGPGIPACSVEAVIRDDFASLAIGLTSEAKAQMTAYGTDVTDFALIPADNSPNSLDPPFSGFVWRNSEPNKNRIPPGSYIAFLFDGRTPAWRDPEFQERIKRLGTAITLAPADDKFLLLDFKPDLDSPKSHPDGVSLGRVLP